MDGADPATPDSPIQNSNMLSRLTHAAIAFAVTVVVYQIYVLLAVPFLEPALAGVAETSGAIDAQHAQAGPVPHKHRELLSAYFSPGHWTLAKPPKTFEYDQLMIVLDDYRPSDDGKLRVNKCVLIFFPQARLRGEAPPRNAVILEAPHGAVLQMDDGFRPGLGGLGRLQWGQLVGKITVRSKMRARGPEDDLLLTTRDVHITEDLIRTEAKVSMRLGPHEGHGRVMEIRLVADQQKDAVGNRFNFGGIDSLEILYDVDARLVPGSAGLPGESKSHQAAAPLHVASEGRFRFDIARSEASFKKRVRVSQLHAEGVHDQLRCEELTLFMASVPEEGRTSETRLQAGSIMAVGTAQAPVVLDAPSRQATARCERMWLELGSRRITLDGSDEVMLTYQGTEIHAPMVWYQAPASDSAHRVGTLAAKGNGWILARSGDSPSSQPMELRWTKELQLVRSEGRPILFVRGRPRLQLVGLGRLWADELEVTLRERAADGSEADLLPSDIVPHRVVATGGIAIDSSQLSGSVANKLEVFLEYAPSTAIVSPTDDGNSGTSKNRLGRSVGERGRSYHIDGQELKVQLTVRDQQLEVTSIDVHGNVSFRETASTRAAPQEPLDVRATYLRVEHADMPSAEITIRGKPATATAAGMSIQAEQLVLNRGTGRARVPSPGVMNLLVDRDLTGRPLAPGQLMTIQWQRAVQVDRDQVTFVGNVNVDLGEGSLSTDRLTARFSAPVLSSGAGRQQRPQLTQLECSGGAFAQFSQRDAGGLKSVQSVYLEESMVVNQKTGKITGNGGGWLESTHLSSGGANLFNNARPRANGGQQLRFLRVDFMRGVEGDLNRRQIAVVGNVKAVYGPVDAWEQKLKKRLRGMPGPDTIWISAERLSVAESPLTRMQQPSGIGPLELSAQENVTIEGRTGDRGSFTTHSQRATYDQLKTTFVLEGDGRQPATLTHQQYVGAPPSETAARKITYNHATGDAKVEELKSAGWKQIDIGQNPRGQQPR